MPYSNISHPYRIDANTLALAATRPGISAVPAVTRFPSSLRLMSFSPAVFTPAYQLLGASSQRFGDDLFQYLAGVRAFFERADIAGGIDLTNSGNADFKRRVSEDLGVAYAALFMVNVFGVTWDTITQIPANIALSKNRPDFLGFADQERFLFEAKGTTVLKKVESSMTKAIGQVKEYPEQAVTKIAIVTYLCADNRFFPSASFVVDPPSLPETVPADQPTARLLHFAKILQYIGLPETAKHYLATLARKLTETRSAEIADTSFVASAKLESLMQELTAKLRAERESSRLEIVRIGQTNYVGRYINDPAHGLLIFNGAAERVLTKISALDPQGEEIEVAPLEKDDGYVSMFSDGTVLTIKPVET